MKTSLITAGLLTCLACGVRAEDSTSAATNAPAPVPISHVDPTHRFGAGLLLGEPTGASLKYFLTDKTAIDGAIGWSFHRETDLHLHGDFLWHKHDLFSVSEGQLSLYYGVGARVKFRDRADDQVGVRVPVGVSYLFERVPVDVFAEVAPVLDFTPSARGGFTAGIGVRWWF